ncbi:hypothetical protein JCM19992_20210 [Thermostilla marina]
MKLRFRHVVSGLLCFLCLNWCGIGRAEKFPWPEPVVPQGLGANIHFTTERPGELNMLADSGMTWIRMDFVWSRIEREPGKYDFSAYDRLIADLERHDLRALFILDYVNPHYDEGLSPYSESGRKAFARWAAASVAHFKGRGILWEMYNEPNIRFWRPEPNAENYIKLAIEVGKAIRKTAPDELYIGPATSRIDMAFLEKCFQGGLLEYWDAVSVHPYRQSPPETVIPEYEALRELIERYAPKGKTIPIISGEWGYSAAWRNYDEQRQGKYLPRQWLTNYACGIPVSIWYDWHDDGPDPEEPEHHFGMVAYPYHENASPCYSPKPAYTAARTLTQTLAGYRYTRRITYPETEGVHVLRFAKESSEAIAAWTQEPEKRTISVELPKGEYRLVGYLGGDRGRVRSDGKVSLTIDDAPLYVVPVR